MTEISTRLRLAIGLALLFGFLALVVAWALARASYSSGGPLSAPSTIGARFPLPEGVVASWGVILPYNETDSILTIHSVEPVDVDGLDILGVLATDPDDGTIVNALGFPPTGYRTREVDGSILEPDAAVGREFQVVVGIRLSEGRVNGAIHGIRVQYEASDGLYELVMPWTLEVVPP